MIRYIIQTKGSFDLKLAWKHMFGFSGVGLLLRVAGCLLTNLWVFFAVVGGAVGVVEAKSVLSDFMLLTCASSTLRSSNILRHSSRWRPEGRHDIMTHTGVAHCIHRVSSGPPHSNDAHFRRLAAKEYEGPLDGRALQFPRINWIP